MTFLSNIEYLRHIRDSYPQTRYTLNQWNSLYREYECEICIASVKRQYGGGGGASLAVFSVNDLTRVCKSGRYTACVNISCRGDDDESSRIHVCNFLPIVIGTTLDLSVRDQSTDLNLAMRMDPSLPSRLGQVYMFDNFWVFSTFISTDARQCHRYRERTKSTDCFERMYVYDRDGKGHMLCNVAAL